MDMILDGGQGKSQADSNLLIGHPLREQAGNFPLAWSEFSQKPWRSRRAQYNNRHSNDFGAVVINMKIAFAQPCCDFHQLLHWQPAASNGEVRQGDPDRTYFARREIGGFFHG